MTWRWLESTRILQREAYGFDWTVLGRDLPKVVQSLKDNALAIFVEIGETMREFSWKYWAHDDPFVHRQTIIEELVDVAHFMGNMLVALDVTDEEWELHYQLKQQKNRDRQRDGYRVEKGA